MQGFHAEAPSTRRSCFSAPLRALRETDRQGAGARRKQKGGRRHDPAPLRLGRFTSIPRPREGFRGCVTRATAAAGRRSISEIGERASQEVASGPPPPSLYTSGPAALCGCCPTVETAAGRGFLSERLGIRGCRWELIANGQVSVHFAQRWFLAHPDLAYVCVTCLTTTISREPKSGSR